VQRLLRSWAACARDRNCIAPRGVTRWNHNFDQSALSFLLWRLVGGGDLVQSKNSVFLCICSVSYVCARRYGFACKRDRRRYGGDHDMAHPTFHHTSFNDVYFALRRWEPKPYSTNLILRPPGLSGPPLPGKPWPQPHERPPETEWLRNNASFLWDTLRQSLLCPLGLVVWAVPSLLLLWLISYCGRSPRVGE
jgi:hypothetical protein